ncbi:MAG TPA: ABC transporter permease, partial [Gemmatimonadaceae bacterium]
MPASLRQALRSLKRTPVFAVTASVTLMLGIGSVAAMFAIAYGVLLAPLPYGHPDRLISVGLAAPSPAARRVLLPAGAYFTYQRFARRLDDIAFYRTGNGNMWVGTNDDPERVTSTWITASTIPLLQVTPLLGRGYFTAEEEGAHGRNAAIISESVWRSRFHADSGVVGKTLYVNSVPRVVVGVMPESFHFPAADTRLWLPAKLDRAGTTVGDFSWSSVARLKEGANAAEAQADLAAALSRIAESYPRLESGTSTAAWLDQTRPRPTVLALRDEMTNGIARTLWMLAAAAGLVLLVACANVANLMLIRADGRQLELAVREALGAGRMRIATHFLGEALVLTTVAGPVAFVMAWAAVRALVAFGPADVPRLVELNAGGMTVGFVALVSLVSAVVCAAVPAFRLRRTNLSVNLRDGGRSETAGRTRQRLRATIAAVQIAVALVVVAGSALLLRTFERLRHEPPGFDATNVITISTQLPFARYDDSASVSYYARLTAAVAGLPTVRAVGVTNRLPLADGEALQQGFRV